MVYFLQPPIRPILSVACWLYLGRPGPPKTPPKSGLFSAASRLDYALPWPPSARLSFLHRPAGRGQVGGFPTCDLASLVPSREPCAVRPLSEMDSGAMTLTRGPPWKAYQMGSRCRRGSSRRQRVEEICKCLLDIRLREDDVLVVLAKNSFLECHPLFREEDNVLPQSVGKNCFRRDPRRIPWGDYREQNILALDGVELWRGSFWPRNPPPPRPRIHNVKETPGLP